jgi:[acyl-carrier-protein] S-malonyltransferase
MSSTAFLYPGQGAQKVGMGAELLGARPDLYERYLSRADAASGLPVRTYSLEGPADALTRTDVAQPALFALSLAITEAARESGLEPDFVAGHSLGEYTAAVVAGALSLDDGMRLVSLRGRLMNEAQSERPGTMAAIIGLPAEQLSALCEEASKAGLVSPANFNTPSQIVVSGEQSGVARAMALAEQAGAAKVVPLQVGAAFHSALMEPAQRRMGEEMDTVEWHDAAVPIASNARGVLVQDAADVRQALFDQIASPVRWVDCVEALASAGVDTFLELGPGRILSGLVRGILGADASVTSADSPEKLEGFAANRPGH